MINYDDELIFYKKIKSKISEKEKYLNHYIKVNRKVYTFIETYFEYYERGVITEIKFAREKKKIKKLIKEYEEQVYKQENSISDMKEYIYDFESIFRISKK
jgi:hypothetical protein